MSFNVSGKKSRRAPWFDLKKGSKCHRLYFQFVHLINIYWASSQCPNYTRHWGWSWKDKFLWSAPNVVSCSEGERSITDNYNDVGLLLWCNINRVLWDPEEKAADSGTKHSGRVTFELCLKGWIGGIHQEERRRRTFQAEETKCESLGILTEDCIWGMMRNSVRLR